MVPFVRFHVANDNLGNLEKGDHRVTIDAVIFDQDGVILDSERIWNDARHAVAVDHGGQWPPGAQRAMMGMSSTEWSAFMHDELGVELAPEEISALVVERLTQSYRRQLPLMPGAEAAVRGLSRQWPLALASSANRPIIDLVLDLAGLAEAFAVTVSSEEVARGKPAPDVYLEAARRLAVAPGGCVAVEDSANGLRSAHSAGMLVIAVPNREFPPAEDAVAAADVVLESLEQLTVERVRGLAR